MAVFTIQNSIALNNGALVVPRLGTKSFGDDQASKLVHSGVMSVAFGGSGVSLPLGDVTTPGWLRIENLDPANFVKWGPYVGATFYPIGRILAGHSHQFMLDAAAVPSTTTFRMQADTAAVLIAYYLFSR